MCLKPFEEQNFSTLLYTQTCASSYRLCAQGINFTFSCVVVKATSGLYVAVWGHGVSSVEVERSPPPQKPATCTEGSSRGWFNEEQETWIMWQITRFLKKEVGKTSSWVFTKIRRKDYYLPSCLHKWPRSKPVIKPDRTLTLESLTKYDFSLYDWLIVLQKYLHDCQTESSTLILHFCNTSLSHKQKEKYETIGWVIECK